MKKFFSLLAIATLTYVGVANAQATVESATPQEKVTFSNEIKAEKAGVIRDILVENGSAVEFGQPLFVIE